ncbi:MAG TPA: AIR synthase-related protein, partial [Jatrophihabitans sp.]|nr:AIR synthase-related protein [Jatrophihabitans sp.]
TWSPQPIFELIRATGDVPRAELELTFNLGVGMVAVLPAPAVPDALGLLAVRGVPAWELGVVRAADDATAPARVQLAADYAGAAATWC